MSVGDVIDPEMIRYINKRKRKHRTKKLTQEHSRFILALYKQAPERPNFSYVDLLQKVHGISVSNRTISSFFLLRHFSMQQMHRKNTMKKTTIGTAI